MDEQKPASKDAPTTEKSSAVRSSELNNVKALFIANEQKPLVPTFNFLKKRGWIPLYSSTMKEALSRIASDKPTHVMISWTLSNANIPRMEKTISTTFNIPCIVFTEKVLDGKQQHALTSAGIRHYILAPVSGPSVHMKLRKLILDQHQADKTVVEKKKSGPLKKIKNEKIEIKSRLEDVPKDGEWEQAGVSEEGEPIWMLKSKKKSIKNDKKKGSYVFKGKTPPSKDENGNWKMPTDGGTLGFTQEDLEEDNPGNEKTEDDAISLKSNDAKAQSATKPQDSVQKESEDESNRSLKKDVATTTEAPTLAATNKKPGGKSKNTEAPGAAAMLPEEGRTKTADRATGKSGSKLKVKTSEVEDVEDEVSLRVLTDMQTPDEKDDEIESTVTAEKKGKGDSAKIRAELKAKVDAEKRVRAEQKQKQREVREQSQREDLEKSKAEAEKRRQVAAEKALDRENEKKASDLKAKEVAEKDLKNESGKSDAEDKNIKEHGTYGPEDEVARQRLKKAEKEKEGVQRKVQQQEASDSAKKFAEDSKEELENEKKVKLSALTTLDEGKKAREHAERQQNENKILDLSPTGKIARENPEREAVAVDAKDKQSRDLTAADKSEGAGRPAAQGAEGELESVDVQAQGTETQGGSDLQHGQFVAAQENISKDSRFQNKTKLFGKKIDTVLAQCVVKALEQTVVSSDEAKEGVLLQDATCVDCIPIHSSRFKGLLIYATAASEHLGADFSRTMKNSLLNSMNERGEEMKDEGELELQVNAFSFVNVGTEYAEFVTLSQHMGHELGMAFIQSEGVFPALRAPNKEKMIQVELDVVEPGQKIGFDAYIHFPKNEKYIKYLSNGGRMEQKQKDKMAEYEVRHFYIKDKDVKLFKNHCASAFVDRIVRQFIAALNRSA